MLYKIILKKRIWQKIFYFRFFHGSVSPWPLSIPLGPFRFCPKIRGDIREWMFMNSAKSFLFTDNFFSPVSLTPAIRQLNLCLKIFLFYCRCLWQRCKHSFYNNLYDFITITVYNTVRNKLLRDKLHSSMPMSKRSVLPPWIYPSLTTPLIERTVETLDW